MQRDNVIEEVRLKILKKAKRQYPYFIWSVEPDDLLNRHTEGTYYINKRTIVYLGEAQCNNLRLCFYMNITTPDRYGSTKATDESISKALSGIVKMCKERLREMYK